jgi:hypothetical protein
MKRLLVMAAGTLGTVGAALAVTGVITPAPASAQNCALDTPPFTPARAACVAAEQTGEFLRTASPDYNLRVLVFGTVDEDGNRSGLGLVDQPQTFVNSVADFLNGPRSPDPAPDAADASTPAPGTPAP